MRAWKGGGRGWVACAGGGDAPRMKTVANNGWIMDGVVAYVAPIRGEHFRNTKKGVGTLPVDGLPTIQRVAVDLQRYNPESARKHGKLR